MADLEGIKLNVRREVLRALGASVIILRTIGRSPDVLREVESLYEQWLRLSGAEIKGEHIHPVRGTLKDLKFELGSGMVSDCDTAAKHIEGALSAIGDYLEAQTNGDVGDFNAGYLDPGRAEAGDPLSGLKEMQTRLNIRRQALEDIYTAAHAALVRYYRDPGTPLSVSCILGALRRIGNRVRHTPGVPIPAISNPEIFDSIPPIPEPDLIGVEFMTAPELAKHLLQYAKEETGVAGLIPALEKMVAKAEGMQTTLSRYANQATSKAMDLAALKRDAEASRRREEERENRVRVLTRAVKIMGSGYESLHKTLLHVDLSEMHPDSAITAMSPVITQGAILAGDIAREIGEPDASPQALTNAEATFILAP